MSDKITKRTAQEKEFLKNQSAYGMPDNPSNHGFSADQIKGKLYKPSLILFDWLQKLADETSAGFDYFEEDLEETVRETANQIYNDDFIANHQATSTVVINPRTNLSGWELTAFEFTLTAVSSYPCYLITRGGSKLTEEQAKDYMEHMTGSRFLPRYDFNNPKNSIWVTAGGIFLKPQYDATNGMILYIITNPFELNSNKVTSISSASSNLQYPTAKCVWGHINALQEIAAGRCKSLVLSGNATAITSSNFSTQDYKKSDGTNFEDFADFMDYVGAAYESDLHLINADLLSQNDSITLSTSNGSYALYYIGNSQYLVLTYEYIEEKYKTGDNLYIIELNYPDRWFNITSGTTYLQKLETSKVPLEDYPTKAGTETISGNWTFSNPITISGGDGFKLKTSGYDGIFALGLVNVLEFSSGSFWSNVNGFDLGKTGHEFRDLYLTRNLTDGTKSYTIEESMAQFNPQGGGTTIIKWTQMLDFLLDMNTTFTLETAKTNCRCEYKAIIKNISNSSITLTFNGVSNILCNDDNITITNVANNSTLVLPTSTTIEISIISGRMVAINFDAE